MIDSGILHSRTAAAIESLSISCRTLPCDPALADTAAFCQHYGCRLEQAANAIIVMAKGDAARHACCIVLATCKLDVNKKVAGILQTKRCSFASADQTKELTQMEIGGVTPLGLEGMPVYIDSRVMQQDEVVIGGGNRSSKIALRPEELLKIAGATIIEGLALPKAGTEAAV